MPLPIFLPIPVLLPILLGWIRPLIEAILSLF